MVHMYRNETPPPNFFFFLSMFAFLLFYLILKDGETRKKQNVVGKWINISLGINWVGIVCGGGSSLNILSGYVVAGGFRVDAGAWCGEEVKIWLIAE